MRRLLIIIMLWPCLTFGQIGLWRLNGNTNDVFGSTMTNVGTLAYQAGWVSSEGVFTGTQSTRCTKTYLNSVSELTVSMIMSLTDTVVSGGLYGIWGYCGTTYDATKDILFFVDNSTPRYLNVQVNNGADGQARIPIKSIMVLNKRYLFTIVYNGALTGNDNRLKLYVNGVPVTLDYGAYTVPSSTANMGNSYLTIGDISTWALRFKGWIDEVMVDNTAWPAAKVKNSYSLYKGYF